MTVTTEAPATTRPRLTPLQAGALLAAPLVAVIARLFAVPWYEEPEKFIDKLAEHPDQADTGSFLVVLSGILLIPAILALRDLTRPSRLGQVGAALAIGGSVLIACVGAISMLARSMAVNLDRAAAVDLWDTFYNESQGDLVFLGLVAGAVGFVLLGVALFRARAVRLAPAVLTAMGGIGLMMTAPGPAKAFIVGTAVLAVIGFGWVAATARR